MIGSAPQFHYVEGNGRREATCYFHRMNAETATSYADRTAPRHVGEHLRQWRQRRRLSQLDLAGDAEISTRHLSFVETGRAAPSREMVLKLAERLNVPLRERNMLLVAGGVGPRARL
jgi:DNA-binding XRE family transcriptional regulator